MTWRSQGGMKMSIIIRKLIGLTPFIAILILSCLPVYYTWGRLPIWGDTIIYFNSAGLKKYLYQWISLQNGQYFSQNYFPFFIFYKFMELFTHNIYIISATILFSLKVTAGLGIYKLSKLLFAKERVVLYTLPIVFYLLSPAQLNANYYLYIYSFAPWFIYFIFKIIKTNRVMISDLIWLSVILFFSSVNLPNPKYVFHLFTISILIFIISFFLKFINSSFIFKNCGKVLIFIFLSVYLILPQLVFVSYYGAEKYGVHIKAGYKDEGSMMDYGDANLLYMFRLHKNSLNLNENARNQYNSNALVNFSSYAFVILIIANVAFTKNKNHNRKKYEYLLLLLMIIYLFFAAGPNPPFGFLYQHMVESFSLFAFLRTTAGATFFLSIFYALLLFPVVLNQKTIKKQNLIFGLLIIAFGIVGYPLLNGESYKNVRICSPSTDITKHGIIIPQDYFDIQKQLDSIKTDVKVLYSEGASYIATKWGYFGVPIYDFIYNTHNVYCKNITKPSPSIYKIYNIGFILKDESILFQSYPLTINKEDIIMQKKFIKLGKVPDDLFLPHIYSSSFLCSTK